MQRREPLDERQQRVHGGLVGADDDAAAPDLLQLPDRRLGLAGEPEQPLRVVLQQPPGLGQRAVSRGPVEQLLAQLVLEPPDRLADGRLGPVEPGGRRARSSARPQRPETPPDPGSCIR